MKHAYIMILVHLLALVPEIAAGQLGSAGNKTSRGSRNFITNVYFLCNRKNPKISDTREFAVISLKVEQDGFSLA